MPESNDRQLLSRLRTALYGDRDPAESADAFQELVAAVMAFRTVGGDIDRKLAAHFNCDAAFVHHLANGLVAPTPRFRRDAVKKIRGIAVELGVKEG